MERFPVPGFHGIGEETGFHGLLSGLESGINGRIRDQNCGQGVAEWLNFEGQFGQNSERAERPGIKLAHVVAGDILYQLSARLGPGSVWMRDLHSDKHVAYGTVSESDRTAAVAGYDAAQSSALRMRRIQRKELLRPSEDALQFCQRGSRQHGYGHVVRLIFHDAAQSRGVEGDVCGARRVTEMQLRGPSHRYHSGVRFESLAHCMRQLFWRSGELFAIYGEPVNLDAVQFEPQLAKILRIFAPASRLCGEKEAVKKTGNAGRERPSPDCRALRD